MHKEYAPQVLIVEDSFAVSQMIKGVLAHIGYPLLGRARNGNEAITMTQSLKPDVVIMDIEMPELDGLAASREILDSCPTPIVILSAYDDSDLVKRASEAGVGAYLLKPPNAYEVKRAVVIAMARFDDWVALRHMNVELQNALKQVKTLKELLPICSSCKNIRDDDGYWHQVDVYIREHADIEFTHGICPDCLEKLYPDLYKTMKARKQEVLDSLNYLGRTTLPGLALHLGVSENNLFGRLTDMVKIGLVNSIEIDDTVFYEIA